MKTATDPRHKKRIRTFKALFASSFKSEPVNHPTCLKIITRLTEIDNIITQCAPEWPLSQINRTDLAVLRLAIWELIAKPETPTKVSIDEAVEIAKRYGSSSSGSFVNGALAGALPFTRPNDHES